MNPELQRNLWLEVTTHRLWLLPTVILVAAALIAPASVLAPLALGALIIFTVIWGARQAADSIIEEARERTWDIQCMSALGPWSMTWGKLAGATVISWYGGFWCAVVYIAAAAPAERPAHLLVIAVVTGVALAAQGLAMTAALVGMHLERRGKSRLGNALVIVLLVVLLPNLFDLLNPQAQVVWYGQALPRLSFTLGSSLVAAAWGVIAAYRSMCTELKVRTQPGPWLMFTLCMSVYLAGFAADVAASWGEVATRLVSTAVVVACVQSYVAAFALPRDPIAYRRVIAALAAGDNRKALEELPLWLASAACALALGLVALAQGSLPALTNERIDNLGAGALALVCMMWRDLALLHFFSLRNHGRRAAATTLVYIAILDALLPALFDELGWGAIGALFMPSLFAAPHAALAVFAAHAVIALALAVMAWRRSAAINRAGDRRS